MLRKKSIVGRVKISKRIKFEFQNILFDEKEKLTMEKKRMRKIKLICFLKKEKKLIKRIYLLKLIKIKKNNCETQNQFLLTICKIPSLFSEFRFLLKENYSLHKILINFPLSEILLHLTASYSSVDLECYFKNFSTQKPSNIKEAPLFRNLLFFQRSYF